MALTVALLSLCVAAEPAAIVLDAPRLEGGSTVAVSPRGRVTVRAATGGALRWELGLGGPVEHLAVDHQRVYVVTGRTLRALAGGVSRWALDLGARPRGIRVVGRDRLLVRLPGGTLFVDAGRGRFCTPRSPCSGLPAWSVGQIGVPFLDLPGLGVPGLGLVVNPGLLEAGNGYYGVVAPGLLPGFAPAAPRARSAPGARSFRAGPEIEVERGRSGKVRGLSVGAVPAPEVVPSVEPSR